LFFNTLILDILQIDENYAKIGARRRMGTPSGMPLSFY
jgi:hypothetical protein